MTANHRPLEEGDVELIERIRATPCLYDTRDRDFRLVYKKEQQWQTIAEGLAMTHWEARKRWTVLRDRYARELKQLLLHPDSMEYGKNEFFHRMDFLRRFVKKRGVRKKCNSSSSHSENMMLMRRPLEQQVRQNEDDDVKKAIPIKIFKIDRSGSSFESYDNPEQHQQLQQSQLLHMQQQPNQINKSYIIDDSQESIVTGRYSYIEQKVNHEETNTMEEHCEGEQEYQDYVEDTSAAYEPIDEDHETNSTHCVSSHPMSAIAVASSSDNSIAKNISFTTAIADNNLTQLPQLQQRPSNNTIYTHTNNTIPSEPNDSEEYFSKTIALYLKQLSRRYKIKAKVEMMQILEKYIELEETKDNCK